MMGVEIVSKNGSLPEWSYFPPLSLSSAVAYAKQRGNLVLQTKRIDVQTRSNLALGSLRRSAGQEEE